MRRVSVGSVLRALILAAGAVWVLVPLSMLVLAALLPQGVAVTGFPPRSPLTGEHFVRVLTDPVNSLWHFLGNSVVVAGAATAVTVALAVSAAYGLSRISQSRPAAVAHEAFFALRMLPPVTMVIPYFLAYSRFHMLDTRWGLVLAEIPFSLALAVWVLKSFFDAVPRDLDEAASLDGAGKLLVLVRILMPVLSHAVAATAVLTFLTIYIDYILPLTLVNVRAETIPIYLAGFNTQYRFYVGDMMAATIVATIPMLALYVYAQRHMTRMAMVGIH